MDPNALPVTPVDTDQTPITEPVIGPRYRTMPGFIPSKDFSGFAPIVEEPEPQSPISAPSVPPSTASTRRWRRPRTVREFAAQANAVATLILNGQLDIDTGRAYSAIARTAAQMITAEVQRARFLKTEPQLTFEEEVYEED